MNYISIMKVFIGLVDHSRGIIQDKKLAKGSTKVLRRDSYEKRPMLSVMLHPDILRVIRKIAKREEMGVSQVTDEVLYSGLVTLGELESPRQS